MAKLTKQTIDHLLQPGVLFQKDGSINTIKPLEGEDLENANAAYRVGFLHEDINAVIEEINAKRGFTSDEETGTSDNTKTRMTVSDSKLESSLVELFGNGTVLHKVEINYHGIIIRIGSVDL